MLFGSTKCFWCGFPLSIFWESYYYHFLLKPGFNLLFPFSSFYVFLSLFFAYLMSPHALCFHSLLHKTHFLLLIYTNIQFFDCRKDKTQDRTQEKVKNYLLFYSISAEGKDTFVCISESNSKKSITTIFPMCTEILNIITLNCLLIRCTQCEFVYIFSIDSSLKVCSR